jgi:thiol-disulfide isomerase/thioredoxin
MTLTRGFFLPVRRGLPLAVAALVLLPALAGGALAQPPVDAVLRDFQPSDEYILELGGKAVPKAEIFQTEKVGAVLILAPELASAVLINPRGGSVETLIPAKIVRRPDGALDILADAVLKRQGTFELKDDDVRFTVDGKAAAIKPKPPILGLHRAADLRAYGARYEQRAKAYAPDAPVIAALKKQPRDIVVKIYFGSWCPHCQKQVPKAMRVEQELAGSHIRFEYFGLPHAVGQDPEARRVGVSGVPTGILYSAGREVGRINGGEWDSPESAIRDILASAAAPGK